MTLPRLQHVAMIVVAFLSMAAHARAQDTPQVPDYTEHIAPILDLYCLGCHDAATAEGKLVLETFEAIQQGGANGPAIMPGDSGASRLVRMLTGEAEPAMPPDDLEGPNEPEIALIRAWIDAGAKGPNGAEPDRTQLLVPEIETDDDVAKAITSVAFSPDGKRAAAARFSSIELLESNGREVAGRLLDHPGKINSVEFSADGSLLVAGTGVAGLYGEARLWNVADGALRHSFRGHRDTLYAARLSPDGTRLATAGYDRMIQIWDVASGEVLHTLEGHNGAVYDIAFSPGGRFLASASGDETIKLWHVESGRRVDTFSQPLAEQYTVAFSPDGKTIVAGGVDNRLRVWRHLGTDQPRIQPLLFARFAHEGAIVRLAFSSDGRRLASSAEDRTIKLWETETFTETHLYPPQPDVAPALAFAPSGDRLLVGRMDGSMETLPVEGPTATAIASDSSSEFEPAAAGEAELTQAEEQEPNDSPQQAMGFSAPAVIRGRIHSASGEADDDVFRFQAQRGQAWVLEIKASRDGSPLDSLLEVLDESGEPVPRVVLQAVRDSYITFRGIDSSSQDVRVHNWEEMDLNQYLYMQGEVSKIFRMPQGPDSGLQLYGSGGARRCYFDTTGTVHALHEPCYIVQAHPPGARLIANGLPVFPLYYTNDDDGRRRLGTDSRVTFVAPQDGTYLVRVSDVRGQQGEKFHYELTVRPQRPDFEVGINERKLTINAGSGKGFTLAAQRIDSFDGPIEVAIEGLPEGFTVTSPLVIEQGHDAASGVINVAADAQAPPEDAAGKIRVTATAEVEGRRVTKDIATFEQLALADAPKLLVSFATEELVIAPGETISVQLRAERRDFGERIGFEAKNLPHGVIVDNIGLNGILIPEGQTEQTIYLTAANWVPETSRPFYLTTGADGTQTTRPVILRVRRPGASSAAEAASD